jgi:hypothetical protein
LINDIVLCEIGLKEKDHDIYYHSKFNTISNCHFSKSYLNGFIRNVLKTSMNELILFYIYVMARTASTVKIA